MNRRPAARAAAIACAVLAAGCLAPTAKTVEDGTAPPLARVTRAFATATGAEVPLGAVADALAAADVVFLGETHVDDVTHRVELALYEALLARRTGRVVLALEMFTTAAQPALDDYLAGRIDEAAFRARSEPWGNYDTGYRALVERARAARAPVVGSNAPPALVRKVGAGGASAFAALAPAERALLPETLLENSAGYWRRFDRATRGHMGGGGDGGRLYSAQSLWDNTMGWSCARALQRFPGHLVLHVNGGFHSAHGEGTASQCARRAQGARIATVAIEPTADLAGVAFDAGRAAADFVVFAAARARGLQEGTHAVASAREQRYRLHAPAAGRPLPLLVWLCDDGLRSEDALALWTAALGDAAIVAALEPAYGQIEADLHRGGRWFWTDSFDDDVAAAGGALDEVCAYVQRHHAVAGERVVIAGEGSGATVVVAAALWGGSGGPRMLAFTPRGQRKLAERGIPEAPVTARLVSVFAPADEQESWRAEFAQHEHRQGLRSEVGGEADVVGTVRAALGVEPPPVGGAERALLLPPGTGALAAHWQRIAAAALARTGAAVRLPSADFEDLPAKGCLALLVAGEGPAELEAALAERGVDTIAPAAAIDAGLPPAPGPFGGTTILVIPAACPAEVRKAWRAAADRNPMQRHGRFYRLALAFEDESPTLADALQAMVDAGRRNALVVPARFCASAETMQRLEREAAPFAGRVDLSWLPGLGGRIAPALR